jgi:outer membrane protein
MITFRALGLSAAFTLTASAASAQGSPHSIYVGGAFIDIHSKAAALSGGPATPPPGAKLRVDDARTVVLGYAYRVSGPWSVEAVLGVPPRHKVYGEGVIAPFGQVSSVKQISPTVFANYHFGAVAGKLVPFVGAGINFTRFSGERNTASGDLASGGPTTIELSDSWGAAVHAGASYALIDRLSLVAAVAYADVKSDLKATTQTASGAVVRTTRIDFRPVAYTLSLAYAF